MTKHSDKKPVENDFSDNNISNCWGWVSIIVAFFLIRLAFIGCFPLVLVGIGGLIWLNSRVTENRKTFYWRVWVGAFLFWLSMTFFMTYPHWATSIGWISASVYLGCYMPVFLWLCHTIKRVNCPVWVAAPIFWTALEWLQGHLVSGYLMGQLALTLYEAPYLIQLSEFGGSYAVSFFIVLIAALLAQAIPGVQRFDGKSSDRSPASVSVGYLLAAGGVFLAVAGWGGYRVEGLEKQAFSANSQSGSGFGTIEKSPLRVALVQGNVPCQVYADSNLARRSYAEYCPLSEQALALYQRKPGAQTASAFPANSSNSSAQIPCFASNPARVDLLVWPESMYRSFLAVKSDKPLQVPEGLTVSQEEYERNFSEYQKGMKTDLAAVARNYETAFLTGLDKIYYDGDQVRRFNSAVLVNSRGEIASVYSKRHRVPFGEYIPFADIIPFLQEITPVGQGTTAGTEAVGMAIWPTSAQDSLLALETPVQPWIVVPSICYENTLPHVIRRQVAELRDQGVEPDVLVNISNDGWFKGSFEVDFRLACAVFRAVEMRKPHLCSSNGGLAAQISPTGRIVKCGQKGHRNLFFGGVRSEFVLADVPYTSFQSFYSRQGDIFALFCLAISGLSIIITILKPAQSKQTL